MWLQTHLQWWSMVITPITIANEKTKTAILKTSCTCQKEKQPISAATIGLRLWKTIRQKAAVSHHCTSVCFVVCKNHLWWSLSIPVITCVLPHTALFSESLGPDRKFSPLILCVRNIQNVQRGIPISSDQVLTLFTWCQRVRSMSVSTFHPVSGKQNTVMKKKGPVKLPERKIKKAAFRFIY